MLGFLRHARDRGRRARRGRPLPARPIALGGAVGTASRCSHGRARRAGGRRSASRRSALPAIIARVRRVFDLAADPHAIGAHLAQRPGAGCRWSPRGRACGCRAPGTDSSSPCAPCSASRLRVAAARGLAGRLVRAVRRGAPAGQATAPAQCRAASACSPPRRNWRDADLDALPMPRSRRATLRALAEAALADPALFQPRSGRSRRRSRRLRALPGVGEWTAQYIALRELREPDAFPAADIGLLRALPRRGSARGPRAAALLRTAPRPGGPGAPMPPAFLGERGENNGGSGSMTEVITLLADRLDTPSGEIHLLADRAGNLRALDWDDHSERLHKLLERHYGKGGYRLEAARDPHGFASALAAYFAGRLDAIEGLPVRPTGPRSSARSGGNYEGSRAGRRSAMARSRRGSAGRTRCARWGLPMARTRSASWCRATG